jgi:hypothetical protein
VMRGKEYLAAVRADGDRPVAAIGLP